MNSESKASNNPIPNIIIVLISLGFAFLVYILGEQIIRNQAQITQQKQAANFISLAESVADTTIKSLTTLNTLKLRKCDNEALVLMRREVFRSQYVKDLGMFKEDLLVCTTGLGELEQGFREPAPDYLSEDGISLWPNRKLLFFDQTYESIIIRLGQFNAVIDPDDFRSFIASDYVFEIVFKHEKNVIHIL
jgi:sensor c-di-GMP phosphodiesterase-like protein